MNIHMYDIRTFSCNGCLPLYHLMTTIETNIARVYFFSRVKQRCFKRERAEFFTSHHGDSKYPLLRTKLPFRSIAEGHKRSLFDTSFLPFLNERDTRFEKRNTFSVE